MCSNQKLKMGPKQTDKNGKAVECGWKGKNEKKEKLDRHELDSSADNQQPFYPHHPIRFLTEKV